MISGYKNLTGRYLKASMKRTVLTIVGIILSISLISSIGLFFKGIQVAELEDTRNKYGSFHVIFNKVDESLYSKVVNNPKVLRYGSFTMEESIKIKDKINLVEIAATDRALELMPFKAKEGRLPEREGEVAVERWVLSYIDKSAKVGSKIQINDKKYELSGILENTIQNQLDSKGILLTKSDGIDKGNAALAVEISDKTNLDIAVNELKALAPEETITINMQLLVIQGANRSQVIGLYVVLGVIIGIVVISTIAVIYNSFQISVVERIRQFGLLRAVGATPKQIRNLILREGTVLAAIGVPLGLAFGIIAIYCINFAFKLIGADSVLAMKPVISPSIIVISGSVGVLSIYLSAMLPAIFAGGISPLVAISSRNSITKEKIKKRKSLIMQRLFGFEGALASKNIKRSRKRYRVTVFSIVISVVLFVSFKSFVDMSINIASVPNESQNIHFSVIRDVKATRDKIKIEEDIIEDIKSLSTIDKVYKVYDVFDFEAVINKDRQIDEVRKVEGTYREYNGKTALWGSMAVYDEEAFEAAKKYVSSGSIDIEKMNKEKGVIIINKSKIYNSKTDKFYVGPTADMKVGDEIELQYTDMTVEQPKYLEFGKGTVNKVKVMAIVEVEPFNYRGNQSGLKMIATTEVAEHLTGRKDIKPVNLNIRLKDVKNEEYTEEQIENAIKTNPSLSIINNIDNNRKDKTSMLMIKILIYGFVIVVSLISSVNIINTLTTNIILRKREFAALKSIGLTQKGLRKMITLEGILYGVVGSVYGAVVGTGLSYAMYKGFGGVREIPWGIPWQSILIAGAAALIIGYLSVLAPLARIKKENLIEAIREE